MKDKPTVDEETELNSAFSEFQLRSDRIRKVLDEAIFRLQILKYLPAMMENDGEILRKYLNKTEADFVVLVCKDIIFNRVEFENRPDLLLISNMLERVNIHIKTTKGGAGLKSSKNIMSAETYEIHVAYVVDILFKCKPLIDHVLTKKLKTPDVLVTSFIESMIKLREIVDERLKVSAVEEIKKENDLKSAFRSSMILCDNIQELEDQLEKQRQELGKENDRKQAMLDDLSEKVKILKEKTKTDVHKVIYDSETMMMKEYNKSIELQEELEEIAKETTQAYENLLEEHLSQEKLLRAKRLKVEAQLASWVAKYDQDLGEKQAEYEELEKTFNAEKDEYELLEEKFHEQEREYVVLMQEKEDEEQRIREEKAWIYLQNRAARRIQRCWRAYKARKLARKKGRKGKKKGSADKSGKDKKRELTLKGGPDPNALIESKFNTELLADIKDKDAFQKKDVTVEL